MAARYELARVQEAARERNIEIDQARGWETLMPLFDGLEDCLLFARDLILELTAQDFVATVTLQNPPHAGAYDEYARVVSPAILKTYGLVDPQWYLKLKLDSGQLADGVFLVSLHVAERPVGAGRTLQNQGGRS